MLGTSATSGGNFDENGLRSQTPSTTTSEISSDEN